MTLHDTVVHVLPLVAIGVAIQSCWVLPWREPSLVPYDRNSNATITITFDGRPAILNNARLFLFTLTNGAPSWIFNAYGPDRHGTVEITCLKSVIENGTSYVLDDSPANENVFLVVRAEGRLLAYSLDQTRPSEVFIESVSDGRVTGRFILNLVGRAAGPGQNHAEVVCDYFNVPLVSERDDW